MIKHCVNAPMPCKSAFQDRLYGAGNRVMNECGGSNKGKYTCTVCGKESGGFDIKGKKK